MQLRVCRRRCDEHRHGQCQRDRNLDHIPARGRGFGHFTHDHPVGELPACVGGFEQREPHHLARLGRELDDGRRQDQVFGEHQLIGAVGLLSPLAQVGLQRNRRVTLVGDRHGDSAVARGHEDAHRGHRENARVRGNGGSQRAKGQQRQGCDPVEVHGLFMVKADQHFHRVKEVFQVRDAHGSDGTCADAQVHHVRQGRGQGIGGAEGIAPGGCAARQRTRQAHWLDQRELARRAGHANGGTVRAVSGLAGADTARPRRASWGCTSWGMLSALGPVCCGVAREGWLRHGTFRQRELGAGGWPGACGWSHHHGRDRGTARRRHRAGRAVGGATAGKACRVICTSKMPPAVPALQPAAMAPMAAPKAMERSRCIVMVTRSVGDRDRALLVGRSGVRAGGGGALAGLVGGHAAGQRHALGDAGAGGGAAPMVNV